jgi:glutamate/tyrosine decarboxylase-like PLP-dependent enzyme
VIPILGTTYTGEFEPIEEIHDASWPTTPSTA